MIRAAVAHALLLLLPLAFGRANRVTEPRVVACAAILVVLGVLEARAVQSREQPDRSWLAIASSLGLLGTAWLSVWSASERGEPNMSAFIGGAVIACLGIGLRVLAIRALGAGFTSSEVPMPGRPIVRTGIYRYLRHPSEIGLVAVALGLAGLSESRIALGVVAAVIVPTSLLRIRRENEALRAAD